MSEQTLPKHPTSAPARAILAAGAHPTAAPPTAGASPGAGASPTPGGIPGAGASPTPGASPSADVSLLLRAHAERRWLSREVVPVVRQIETPAVLPEEQLPAALAYLEVIWAEAIVRGHATDTARRLLDAEGTGEQPLQARARREHRAVETLRAVVARRVAPLLAAPQPRVAV